MTDMYKLKRRGFHLGTARAGVYINTPTDNWLSGSPILLKEACLSQVTKHQTNLAQSFALYQAILHNQECDPILAKAPYSDRLNLNFESLGCSINEGDDQEIETILFDAIDGKKLIAEDLWMKISWLSFYEGDDSLRFRFSFGVDLEEDVAADKNRQHYASLLTDAVFPESQIITNNSELNQRLQKVLGSQSVNFVERIVYFNSPNGGAYLHHDLERGHAGVVYAQLSGATFWLALPKNELMNELVHFIEASDSTEGIWPESVNRSMQTELLELASNSQQLSKELDGFANSTLIHLINETEAFIQQLIENGHGHIVETGDALLLPQESQQNCCWHSVFCLGEQAGQALSFAIR